MKQLFLTIAALLMCAVSSYAASPSGTLPVMYITTKNNAPITTKTDYVKGTYYLDPKGCAGVDAIGSADSQLDLQIRGRGNYTWTGFDKKPYRLKLGKKAKLMGMESSKHWALLAHADDNQGFLRNAVGFQLSRIIGLPWTPGDAPIEVVLNGDYIGLYFLTETVRVDKKRVNIWDYDSEYEDYADANPGQTLPWQDEYATGGWLCEIDNYDDEDQISITTQEQSMPNRTLRITYDTPSDYITAAHKQWLKNEITTLDDMIVNGDRDACLWSNKIDLNSLAKFFVVNQVMFNYESFHGSCKLWREKGEDSKWNFGPVWDFGSAFQPTATPSGYFYDYGLYSNHWIGTMMKYPAFFTEVKNVYAELMEGDFDSIYEFIDSYVSKISSAAASDKERWPQYGNDNMSDKASFVKSRLAAQVQNCDNLFNNESGDTVTPFYLRGDFNNWAYGPQYKFSGSGDGIYSITIENFSGRFKLGSEDWTVVNYGGVDDIPFDTPVKLEKFGENCTLAETADKLTFTFNWNTKELTVSKDGGSINPPSDELKLYFIDNGLSPWEQVYIYTWSDQLNGEWPGSPMTHEGSANMYPRANSTLWSYTFTSETGKPVHNKTGMVFNDGNSGKPDHQTENIIYSSSSNYYNRDGMTTAIVDMVISSDESPTEYYTLQGARVASPDMPGIYIVRRGNKTSKIVVR